MPSSHPNSQRAPAIRRARRRDLPALAEMISALAAHHGDRATLCLADLERDLFAPRPWATGLVAATASGLAGCAILQRFVRLQFGERGMELHLLFVAPAARGTGLGRRLVGAAIDEAAACGCSQFVVGAHPDNDRAQVFYERLGLERRPPPGPRFAMRLRAPNPAKTGV